MDLSFFKNFLIPSEQGQVDDDDDDGDQSLNNDEGRMETDEALNSPSAPQQLSSQATLVDLLVEAFPDSKIEAPKIVIVGSQSSGKTKLIISMILQRLNSHSQFTDSMGDTLLKVFRTGRGLTTRRPVVVNLLHTSDQQVCTMRFRHEQDTYDFGDPMLDHFLNSLNDYSGNEIFESALEITIKAFQLPNIQFTDMPGLRSSDVELKNARTALTLNDLVERCIANPSNTVVAVETASQFANAGEDVALLPRLLKKVKDKDPSLVGRSILVLTMCDKIVPETFKQDTLPTIDGDSRSTYASYFTDIVCVSNKIDGQKEPHEVSFLEFRRIFEETKRQELLVFQQRGNLSTTDRCTTEAVFRKIDSVFKLLLEQALQVGHENLQKLVGEKKSEMLRLLAPPPHLYQDNESGHGGRFLFSKQMLLQEISEKAKSFMASAIQGMQLFPDADPNFETKATYLQTKTGVEWPITFQRGDISSGLQRRAYFKKALEELKDYESDVLHKVDQMFMDPTEGVFAAKHSPFHRIHRFPNLQTRLRERFVSIGGNAGQLFHTKLDAYLNRIWENEEPTGQLTIERLVDIMENARHLFLIDCHEYLDEKLTGALIDLTEANLLAEADDFVQRRQLLNYEYERTSLQMRYLLECLTLQNDSERLMAQIQEAKRALSSFTEPTNEWEQVFWEESYLQYRRSLSAPPSVASSQQHYLQLSQQNHVSFAAAAVGSLLVTTLSHQRDHANNSDSSGSTSTSSAAATARTSSVSLFSPTKTFVKRSPDSTAKHATIASPNIVGTQMEEDEPNNETYENGEQGAPKTTLPDNFRTSRSPLGTEKPPRATPGLSDSETSDGESDGEGDHGKKRNREVDEGGSAKRSRVQQAEETQNSSWLPTSWFQSRSPPPTTTRASLPAPTRPHASLLRDDNGSQPKEESKSVSLHSPTYPTLKREREQVPLGLPAPPAPPATQTPLRDTDTNGMQQSSALGSTEGNQRRRLPSSVGRTFAQLQQMVQSSQPPQGRTPSSKDEPVDLT